MADQVTVKSKFGQFGTVNKTDLSNALSHGFSVANDDEITEHNNKEEYGSGLVNPAIAGLEEAAGTATFGVSRELENASGLTTPEAQAARAKYNPMARMAGTVGGLVADPFGAIGRTSSIGGQIAEGTANLIGRAAPEASLAARAIKNVPAAATGLAAEGAAYGLGNSVTEHALGDPDLNAEHVMSNVGYGALFSGAIGGLMEGGANVFGKSMVKGGEKIVADKAPEAAMASHMDDIAKGVEASEIAQTPSALPQDTPFKDFPKSIDEIQNAVKSAGPLVDEAQPSLQALKDADANLPDLQYKTHALQYESLKDRASRDYYKTFLEGQSEESKALASYEALQKSESVVKLDNTIQDIAPGAKLEADPVAAGESAIEGFSKQYNQEKQDLAPIFKQIDKASEGISHGTFDTLLKLSSAFPDIDKYLTADAEGVFKLEKYKAKMPFSEETHKAIDYLVEAANDKDLTLSGLKNVRDKMRSLAKFDSDPRAAMEISSIRKMLMDEMQAHVEKLVPDIQVRNTFARYAQNEEKRAVIEKIMGGSISDKASFAKTIKPEDVLNRIFSSTVSTNAAKEILGKDFNKVLADYLAGKKSAMTDAAKNGFSSNKFATFLRGKSPELSEALSEAPNQLQRINHLTDRMRILPDSPSINPSGTATKLSIMEKMAGISRVLRPDHLMEDFAKKYVEKGAAAKQRYTIDEVLAGKHLGAAKEAAEEKYANSSKLAKLERIAQNAAYNIEKGAKAIFGKAADFAKKSTGLVGSKLAPSPLHKEDDADNSNHKDVFARIRELSNDPEKMIDEMQAATKDLYPHAPMISQGVQAAATRATQFLSTKMPMVPPPEAFSKSTYTPSTTEISQFERYYNMVENPLEAFDLIRGNQVTPEAIETLSMVYPKMYDQMKTAIIGHAADHLNKNGAIPYQTRQSISLFLGEPMDQAMSPQSVQTYQMAMIPPKNTPTGQGGSGPSKLTVADRMSVQRPREA